ncbi:EFR1 family ferrodoxin [Fusibacter paucivorans]|uniref:EFR1 family ferrodoxin n=1 Tax=Fusibacter paucivorans TaxID=76009 RepID=A0ABS5PPN2_9FIRM|nr:EFR1 family ferrodoxin [Fusibacter paucivorans]MBS7526354.1 EFR1 family ferrodoxin [Fusibacter paucivorans]
MCPSMSNTKAKLYYFSGTGNSLAVAKQLAKGLHATYYSMSDTQSDASASSETAEIIGFIFPVYNHLTPYIVKRFVQQLKISESTYCFAVCTYGDSPCVSLPYLQTLLVEKAVPLAGGFGIQMPYNYINPSGGFLSIFKPFTLRMQSNTVKSQLFSNGDRKCDAIIDYVKNRKFGTIESAYDRTERVVDLLNLRETLQKSFWLRKAGYLKKTPLSHMASITLMDHGFHSTKSCTSCGTCTQICPVHNISLSEGIPKWHHQCEQCFACLQWCPVQAIQFGSGTKGQERYHHPKITLAEMLHLS